MSGWNYKQINGFTYLEELLNIGVEYREVDLARVKVQNSDLPNKFWHVYKYGQMLSNIRRFRDDQLQNLHSLVYVIDGISICCCGLVLGSIGDDDAPGKPLLPDIKGHIAYPSKELTTFFVVYGEGETTEDGQLRPTFNWYCQECTHLVPAVELPEDGFEVCVHECIRAVAR